MPWIQVLTALLIPATCQYIPCKAAGSGYSSWLPAIHVGSWPLASARPSPADRAPGSESTDWRERPLLPPSFLLCSPTPLKLKRAPNQHLESKLCAKMCWCLQPGRKCRLSSSRGGGKTRPWGLQFLPCAPSSHRSGALSNTKPLLPVWSRTHLFSTHSQFPS